MMYDMTHVRGFNAINTTNHVSFFGTTACHTCLENILKKNRQRSLCKNALTNISISVVSL